MGITLHEPRWSCLIAVGVCSRSRGLSQVASGRLSRGLPARHRLVGCDVAPPRGRSPAAQLRYCVCTGTENIAVRMWCFVASDDR